MANQGRLVDAAAWRTKSRPGKATGTPFLTRPMMTIRPPGRVHRCISFTHSRARSGGRWCRRPKHLASSKIPSRNGKLAAEPTTLEPPMTNAKPNSSSEKGKGGSAGGSPPARHAEKRFKFDAGPISLVGAAVTLGLFLLNLWMQGRPQIMPVVEEKTAATSPAAEAPRSAPAAVSAPAASAPPAAEAPAAAPAPQSPQQGAAPEAPPAPSAESAPPSSAPAASASASRAEPPPAPAAPSAEIHATRREPQAAAPAPPAEPAPRAANSAPAPAPAAAAPQRKSRIDATNKASEALRAEQLERMKAGKAAGDGGAAGASGAAATGNPTTAAGQ